MQTHTQAQIPFTMDNFGIDTVNQRNSQRCIKTATECCVLVFARRRFFAVILLCIYLRLAFVFMYLYAIDGCVALMLICIYGKKLKIFYNAHRNFKAGVNFKK